MAVDTQIALAAVLIFGISLGVLGNLAVIISICVTRKLLRSNYYYLLLHLAFCDLFNLLLLTQIVYSIFNDNFSIISYSYFLCKMWQPIHTVFFTGGPSFLILVSLVRYRAIVQPFKLAMTRRTLKILSTFVYVFAVICIIPLVLVLKFDESTGCTEEWPLDSLNIAYTIFLACVQYFIPAVALSIIYFKICKKLITHNRIIMFMNISSKVRQQNNRSPTPFQSLTSRNTKSFIVIFIIVMCFVVSTAPMEVQAIVDVISKKEFSTYSLWLGTVYLIGTLVLNPYVYGAIDKKVFLLFTNCRKRRNLATHV